LLLLLLWTLVVGWIGIDELDDDIAIKDGHNDDNDDDDDNGADDGSILLFEYVTSRVAFWGIFSSFWRSEGDTIVLY